MKVAKAKGRLRGKQPKALPGHEAHFVKLYRAGGHTVGELEEVLAVTRSTVCRPIRRADRAAGSDAQAA
jgi:DNA-binding MarR family transcriptional regulator